MPELPEVETVMRGLEPVMTDRRITAAMAFRPDLRWPLPAHFAERLSGQRVQHLARRGKAIIVDLAGGESLLIHLGMSGRIRIFRPEDDVEPPGKHDHVVIETDAPARIVFHDPRRFGAMDIASTANLDRHGWFARLGVEPLGNGFSAAYLMERLEGRRAPIKALLLDQRLIAGLGNIYVCEALYRSGIHPARLGGTVTGAETARLVTDIRDVLAEAIAAGGSSLRDHRQTDGTLGYFQHGFSVYGREGEACRKPHCPGVIARLVQSGRSSFYCPDCQH